MVKMYHALQLGSEQLHQKAKCSFIGAKSLYMVCTSFILSDNSLYIVSFYLENYNGNKSGYIHTNADLF